MTKQFLFLLVLLFIFVLMTCGSSKLQKLSIDCELGNTESCELLQEEAMKILRNHREISTKTEQAFNYIKDQNFLFEIVEKGYHYYRFKALHRITDEELLAKIAKKDSISMLKLNAIKRLSNQKILKDIALNDKWEKASIEAIKNITDQQLLLMIIEEHSSKNVKESAINRLTDYNLIKKLTYSQHIIIANSAKHKLDLFDKDIETVLFESYLTEDLRRIYPFYFTPLPTDSKKYRECYKKNEKLLNHQFRIAQKGLDDIYKKIDNAIKIIDEIDDQKILGRIAIQANEKKVREAAIKKLSPRTKLENSYWINTSNHVSLNSSSILLDICLNAKDFEIRKSAIEQLIRINDKSVIDSLIFCLNSNNIQIKRNALFALGKMQDTQAIEPLLEFFYKQHKLRPYTIEALGNFHDDRIIDILLSIVFDLRLNKEVLTRNRRRDKEIQEILHQRWGAKESDLPELLKYDKKKLKRLSYNSMYIPGDEYFVDMILYQAEQALVKQGTSIIPVLENTFDVNRPFLDKHRMIARYLGTHSTQFIKKRIDNIIKEIKDKNLE